MSTAHTKKNKNLFRQTPFGAYNLIDETKLMKELHSKAHSVVLPVDSLRSSVQPYTTRIACLAQMPKPNLEEFFNEKLSLEKPKRINSECILEGSCAPSASTSAAAAAAAAAGGGKK